jgi:group I intron endonuclease
MFGKKHSMFGKKHAEETLAKISGENHHMFGKNHSDETRKKNILAEPHALNGKPKPDGAGSPAQKIEVFDLQENTTTTYESICEAARALEIHMSIITKYFIRNQQKPYKGRYTFTKL